MKHICACLFLIWSSALYSQRFNTLIGGGANLSTVYETFRFRNQKLFTNGLPYSSDRGYALFYQAYLLETFRLNDRLSIQAGFKVHKNGAKYSSYNFFTQTLEEESTWSWSLGIPLQLKYRPLKKYPFYFLLGMTGSEIYYWDWDAYYRLSGSISVVDYLTSDVGIGWQIKRLAMQASWHQTVKSLEDSELYVVSGIENNEFIWTPVSTTLQSTFFELNVYYSLFKAKSKK